MKKLLTTLILSAFSLSAQAKYMGMNEMPIQDGEVDVVFANAVKTGNIELIERLLETGFSLDYTFDDVCMFSGDLHKFSHITVPKTDEEYKKFAVSQASTNALWQTYFTSCEKLPLLSLHKGFVWDYTDHLNKKNEHKMKDYEKQKEKVKLVNYFIDKLSPNQYEQLFVYASNPEMPFEVKKKALLKIIEATKDIDKIELNEVQIKFKEYLESIDDTRTSHRYYLDINNHIINTLLHSYIKGYLDATNNYTNRLYGHLSTMESKRRSYDVDLLSIHQQYPNLLKLNVETLENGKFTIDNKNTFNNDNLKIALIRVQENLELLNILLNSGLVDLSQQDVNGNTILHLVFYRYADLLTENDYAPSFVRFLLESGANPMLLNKEGSSAFKIFQDATDRKITYPISGPVISKINDAFVLKDFKD